MNHGETEELRIAGRYVRDNFPGLMELSEAAHQAKCDVRSRWEREREEELRRLYPEDYQ